MDVPHDLMRRVEGARVGGAERIMDHPSQAAAQIEERCAMPEEEELLPGSPIPADSSQRELELP